MFQIRMLPAREGDAIWVRWGNPNSPYQMIVDMGTEATGKLIRTELEELSKEARQFELLVITHVDRDHIGGVLSCVAEAPPLEGMSFKDVWFNGWHHLHGRHVQNATKVESFGAAQGERLSHWLRNQSWNVAFEGGPCRRVTGQAAPSIELQGGMSVSVLGPTPDRLERFVDKWKDEVLIALKKGVLENASDDLEVYGSDEPPKLIEKNDLFKLANEKVDKKDTSHANGSSIALLLSYQGRRVVLAGDAYADDLLEGLESSLDSNDMAVDAFKLSHHCSTKNISKELIESLTCPNWLVSTDGTRFKHPDKEAIARVIAYSKHKPSNLMFNAKSKYNGWWNQESWKRRYKYQTEYGNEEKGLIFDINY